MATMVPIPHLDLSQLPNLSLHLRSETHRIQEIPCEKSVLSTAHSHSVIDVFLLHVF